jgi:hypothetical protein
MGLHRHDVTLRSTASCALCLLSDGRTDGHTSVSGTLHYLHYSSNRALNYIACWRDRMKLRSLIRNYTASYFTRLVIPIASVLTLSALIYFQLSARNWHSSRRDVDGTEHLNDISGGKHLTSGTGWLKN